MQIIKKEISAKNAAGTVKLKAVEEEDIYHLYHIIAVGDKVHGSTTRNVVTESSTGSTRKNKVRMNVALAVEHVDFDAEQCSLRLKGRNCEENEHMKVPPPPLLVPLLRSRRHSVTPLLTSLPTLPILTPRLHLHFGRRSWANSTRWKSAWTTCTP